MVLHEAAPLKFINHSIDDFAMQVTYRPDTHEGRLVYNLSLVKNEDLEFAIGILKDAYTTRVAASGLVKFFKSGERVEDFVVPRGQTAICTVCSVTFDGLLIRHGIPINPIGGGIVEIENRTPIRFTHMILYQVHDHRPPAGAQLPEAHVGDQRHAAGQRQHPCQHPRIPHGGRASCGRGP